MLALLLALALGGELPALKGVPAESESAPAELGLEEVEQARALAAQDPSAGRAVLEHLAAHGESAAVRAEAEAALAEVPAPMAWAPTAKLFGWQMLAGAWMGGPAVALSVRRPIHPNLTTSGMALGAVVGGGSALVYSRFRGLSAADAGLIVTAQQLGTWHGVVGAVLVDSSRFEAPTGASVGLALGAVGGYLGAELTELPRNAVAGAWHGSLWGTGLGYLWLTLLSETYDGHWRSQWTTLLLATDLGAVGGYALARTAGLDEIDFFAADAGIGLGLLVCAMIFADDREDTWGSTEGALLVLGASAAGGVGAVLLERQLRAADKLPVLAGLHPSLRIAPTREGVRAELGGQWTF